METELNQPKNNTFIDGNIEAACSMSKRYMQNTQCTANVKNEMAIGFLNSGIQFDRYKYRDIYRGSSSSSSSSESFEGHGFKPCLAHFDTR